jgi:hypothetical protein
VVDPNRGGDPVPLDRVAFRVSNSMMAADLMRYVVLTQPVVSSGSSAQPPNSTDIAEQTFSSSAVGDAMETFLGMLPAWKHSLDHFFQLGDWWEGLVTPLLDRVLRTESTSGEEVDQVKLDQGSDERSSCAFAHVPGAPAEAASGAWFFLAAALLGVGLRDPQAPPRGSASAGRRGGRKNPGTII